MISLVILLGFLLLLSAFFSGIETALMSINNIKVEHLFQEKKRGSKHLKKLKDDMGSTVIAILIGNNIVNIGATVLATIIFTDLFKSAGAGIATGVMTFLTLVFGEITPKSYCLINSEKISLRFGFLIYYFKKILFPLVWFFSLFTKIINKWSGNTTNVLFTEEEFKTMIDLGKKTRVLENFESKLIEEVLEFNDLKISEVLVPKNEVFMIEASTKILVALDSISESGFSRIPIYDESKNYPVGFVHVHEILKSFGNKIYDVTMRDLITEPLKITQNEIIDDIFQKMTREKKHMGFVYNGKNEFIGIVTLEDLIEEIFGEIEDESDKKVQEASMELAQDNNDVNNNIVVSIKKED